MSVGNKEELGNIDQIIDLRSSKSDWYIIPILSSLLLILDFRRKNL